jgi:hypothetical protein
METYHAEVTISEDGKLVMTDLPFHAGEKVEVIVRPQVAPETSDRDYPLRGTTYQYIDPFAPVAEDDWDVLQ